MDSAVDRFACRYCLGHRGNKSECNNKMTESIDDLMARRMRLLGPNVATFYEEPVNVVRGEGVWLWDAQGNKYLDCYNNVAHVGHCNSRVVDAIYRQASILNTHTRYPHEGILNYIERLTATMDNSLSTAIMTCTGSEANDIALRMAEAVTGRRGIIATDATYHGNTALVSQLSRSNIPNVGFGLEQYFNHVAAPDSYRTADPQGILFAEHVAKQIEVLQASEHGFAALLVCPLFLNEGFPQQDVGWLQPAANVVRQAGGLLICDEVQSGFGRIGTHFWAYQKQQVIPDVVVLGKPMANGHPVGAVVTSSDTMVSFREQFRYFNTFGGNPVSCAAATAVLDELQDNDFLAHAKAVGDYSLQRLGELQKKYEVIGDVRGAGLVFGAELVTDQATKQPATELTDRVVNALRHKGILLSKLGRYKNTLKIRPPMPFKYARRCSCRNAIISTSMSAKVNRLNRRSWGRAKKRERLGDHIMEIDWLIPSELGQFNRYNLVTTKQFVEKTPQATKPRSSRKQTAQ